MDGKGELLSNEHAQTEANLIREAEERGFSDIVVKQNVKPEFQEKMLGNAKTDIAAQHIESIKKNNPDIYELMVKQSDAIKSIASHFLDKAKFDKIDSDGKIEMWEDAEDKAMTRLRFIQETYEEKNEKAKPISRISIIAEAINEAEDAHLLNSFRDEVIYGDIVNAITAGNEAVRRNRISNPKSKIDINSSYQRQQRFNKVFDENKDKAVSPQPLS